MSINLKLNGIIGRTLEKVWAYSADFQVALVIKNPPASAGDVRDLGLVPGLGRSPGEGNGNPLQYFCLENPMDRGTWWTTVHGVTKGQTQLKWLSTHEYTKQTHRRRISSNGICRVRVGLSVQERSAEVLPGTPCGCRPGGLPQLRSQAFPTQGRAEPHVANSDLWGAAAKINESWGGLSGEGFLFCNSEEEARNI